MQVVACLMTWKRMLPVSVRRHCFFCFQSKFMKNMLLKYGTAVVCLDSTHKTSDYALPLFLIVKTPVSYATASMFIVQFETACCIAEALSVLCSNNGVKICLHNTGWWITVRQRWVPSTKFFKVRYPSVISTGARLGRDGSAEKKWCVKS